MKTILERLLLEFIINQNFPRFSTCGRGWRKARESLIYIKNRAETSRSDIIFNLVIPTKT